ncbi:MAG: zonular occludens toxin domain-containing protein [Hydrogenobacter thermophilus]|uniref:zonular occludens toxin domain-containing protein n=1 Tax=Hydrogenobacter thermophilus TaxID=940 RepID=UPI001C7691BA|nr:zonular occludens toxin domain-containing protein [Hydrogenobacter thermophilus]QWK20204.1 MAG: zonular occludens toxin domain-containing protein [Hydrogenobacter thermophilus]
MIIFITGTPGAGKTYYSVLRMLDDLKKDSVLVVSNIDGVSKEKFEFYLGKSVNFMTFDEFLSFALSLVNMRYDGNYRNAFLTLLNVDYWKRYVIPALYQQGIKKVVFYLDEFQSIIDEDTDLTQPQKFFFDYHRHLGIDIYIITQSIQRMSKAIRNLVEVELRLVSLRMFGLESFFVLKTLIGGVPVKKKAMKYKPEIFALYRSLLVEHMKGVRGRPPVMLFVGFAVLLFSLYSGYSYMRQAGGVLPKQTKAQQTQVQTKENTGFTRSLWSGSNSLPESSYPSPSYSPPSGSSYKESYKESVYLSSSGSSPAPSSSVSSGYGHIVIEYAPPSRSNGDSFSLPEGPTIKEVP